MSPVYGNLWCVVFSLLEFSLDLSVSNSLLFKNNFVYQSNIRRKEDLQMVVLSGQLF